MKIRHFSISQQGDSHIKTNTNCQDYSKSVNVINQRLHTEMVIAAIADGVGSCDYSEYGSRTAVETAVEFLSQELVKLQHISPETVGTLLKEAFEKAYDSIEQEADKQEISFALFDTTLTITVLVENGECYFGHIGDDGIVALYRDGSYKMITSRIEGEEANSVVPLSSKEHWTFAATKKPVAALALMTDGLLDKSVGTERLNNRVFYPFFDKMFTNIMENDQDEIDLRSYWDNELKDKTFRTKHTVTDDITLCVVQIPSILKQVHPKPFDEKQWNETSLQMRDVLEGKLNASNKSNSSNNSAVNDQAETDDPKGQSPSNYQEDTGGKIPKMEFPNSHNVGRRADNYANSTDVTSGEKKLSSASNCQSNNKKFHITKLVLRIAIGCLAVCCIMGIVLYGHNKYTNGIKYGQTQERATKEAIIETMKQEHEKELENAYKKGFIDGAEDARIKMAETSTPQPEVPMIASTPQPGMPMIAQKTYLNGSKGEDVKTIQNMLIKKGWTIKADGKFGEKTETAVKEFQEKNGLNSTGTVDILTFWALMNEKSIGNNSFEQPLETTVPITPKPEETIETDIPNTPQPEETVETDLSITPNPEVVEDIIL